MKSNIKTNSLVELIMINNINKDDNILISVAQYLAYGSP